MDSMNVLCLIPFISRALCDDAFMFMEIRNKGAKMAVISSKSPGYRGRWDIPNYVNMNNVHVYRLYRNLDEMFIFPEKGLRKALEIAYALKPDLIFCSHELNMRLALIIQRVLKTPIVLRVENASGIFNSRSYQSWKFSSIMRILRLPSNGYTFWSWLCEKSDALITCNPADQHFLDVLSMHGKPVFYLPWPAHVPAELEKEKKNKKVGIYAGSLHPSKNIQVFEWVIPRILRETPTERFTIIGTGSLVKIIKKLIQRFPDAIRYYPQLPRAEVLRLIASSYYGYSPCGPGIGYGFIADCWGAGTPILLNYSVSNSRQVNVAVANNEDDLIRIINRLYADFKFYKKLQNFGYNEYEKRSAKVVAHELYEIFLRTLNMC